MKLLLSSLAATTLIAGAATGQTTTPGQQAPTQSPPAESAPAGQDMAATGAGAASASSVTDTEVRQYAAAALAVNKINADATVPAAEKNTRFVAAITATGLQPQRFNEISQAMAADSALNQRIQAAAAQAQTGGQSAQATTPNGPTGN